MNIPKLKTGVKLIGIHGHANSGKDTVAGYLCQTFYNTYAESFATPLKAAAAKAFGFDIELFDARETKEEALPIWRVSPRQIAQFMGTELFRNNIDKLMPGMGDNFWVVRMAAMLNNELPEPEAIYEDDDVIIIPDVRFQNEYDWIIENNGIIIHLTRPGADGNIGIPGHTSESSLNLHDNERTFPCVNDSTKETLFDKIDSLISNLNIYS